MKRLLLATAIFAGVLTAFVANPSPAGATGTQGRWFVPPFVSDRGEHPDNSADGAYYWEDRGFNGYTGPVLPRYHDGSQCTSPAYGEIRVCEVASWIVEHYSCNLMRSCGTNPNRFVWKNTYTNRTTGQKTINSAYILIADDLWAPYRQNAYRSAFGVALGLTFGASDGCIMDVYSTNRIDYVGSDGYGYNVQRATGNDWPDYSCQEDINAMSGLYPGSSW